MSVDSLMSVNRITDVLQVHEGDTILIPLPGDSMKGPLTAPSQADSVVYYKVKDGDTLLRIAAAFGVPVDSIYKENKLKPDTVLIPGKVIKVVKAPGM